MSFEIPETLKAEIAEHARFARRLASAARGQTLPRFRNAAQIFNKAGPWYDPVTDADRDAERVIAEIVERVYPTHGLLGEEFGERKGDGPWRWVIDPVDGTRAFVCGIPTWATLIALEYEGTPVLGVVDQPYTDELWIGSGAGALFCRGEHERSCRTSGLSDLAKARLTTTDPRAQIYMNDGEADAFAQLSAATRLTRFGLDAYGYGLLALGEIDIVAETGLQLHDYAALKPVVEAAGGVMTNWTGGPVSSDDRGEVLASASPELHSAALAVLAG